MYNDNFYKSFINESINPFILFDNNGKIVDCNYEAEIVLNYVKQKELFELAMSHSPHNFGFKNSYIHLRYGKSSYYAILVGYIDDQHIGLELYKQINVEKEISKIEDIELVNIFSLIEISKNTTLDIQKTELEEIYDTSIPEIKVNINNFLITLNECFKLFEASKKLNIKVSLKIGEYEIIEGKKYNIINILYIGDRAIKPQQDLENQALKSHINLFEVENGVSLEFPMIL